jgi:transcriptional regulator with XRE-family HTH domain
MTDMELGQLAQPPDHFAESVRKARLLKGWSVDQLAQKAGIKRDTLSDLENGTRTPRGATKDAVARALGETITNLTYGHLSIEVVSDTDALEERLSKLLLDGTDTLHIRGAEFLHWLRREAERHRTRDHEEYAGMLLSLIKQFCVLSEVYLTDQIAGSTDQPLLYSCSALVDEGPGSYRNDPAWNVLLKEMGRAASQYDRHVLRVFFLDPVKMSQSSDYDDVAHVVQQHLRQGVNVALLDQRSVDISLLAKRNVAWIGGEVLLDATDQISWDLDVTRYRRSISDAREKLDHYLNSALVHLSREASPAETAHKLAEAFLKLREP